MAERLHFIIRTAHAVAWDAPLTAARLPTETGQIGLRARVEPCVLAIEPGLIVLRDDAHTRFAASAGGLLEVDRERAVLYTPFAVVGERGEDVVAALARAFAVPDSELSARRKLGELEQRIVHELSQPTTRNGRSAP